MAGKIFECVPHGGISTSSSEIGRGQRLVVLLQAGDVSGDGVLDVGESLVTGFPLGNAAWERGAFCDEYTIFIRLDDNSEFHAGNLPFQSREVNSTTRLLSPSSLPGTRTYRP